MAASVRPRPRPWPTVRYALPPDRNKSTRIQTRSPSRDLPWPQYSDLRVMLPFYFRMSRLDGARMNRTGLIRALAIAVIAGLVFGLYPELDLRIARHFYAIEDGNHNLFALRLYPPLLLARNLGLWIGAVPVAAATGALLIKLIFPRRKLLMPGRAVVFLISTMILGPGLMANVILKDHWGRSRPIDVTQFGGTEHFVGWWDPRGDCPANC